MMLEAFGMAIKARRLAWLTVGLGVIWAGLCPRGAESGEVLATSPEAFLREAAGLGEAKMVRMRGVVTHSISDRTFFIQEGAAGVYVFHRPEKALERGEIVEVTGNPSLGGLVPTLQNCTMTVVGQGEVPEAIAVTLAEAGRATNAMKRVRMRGRLERHRLAQGRSLVLHREGGEGGFVVDAEAVKNLGGLGELPAGCLVEATGILVPKRGPDGNVDSVRVLIGSAGDVVMLEGPPFWNQDRLVQAAVGIAAALALAGAWIVLLRREVKRRTAGIEQRLEREAALRASEDRFAKVFRTTPDVLLIARAEDERIMDVNPAFERITGYTKAEAVERTTVDLGLAPDPGFRQDVLGQFKEGKPVVNLLIQALRKTGEPIWMLASMEWIEWNGQRCWLTVARDITEKKRAEDEQRQAESAHQQSQKMEALGTMAGGIAHDFNNILAAILANAELADLRISDDPDQIRENLGGIRSAAIRGKNLVSQIQAFSRKQRRNKQAMQLEATVAEGARLLQAIAAGSIRVELKIDGQCPPAWADADAILQVVVNLGTNACHAMERRPGTVRIDLEPCKVGCEGARRHPELKEGEYLRLTVADEGEGMDSETQRRIFDPFFTTKAPGKGTGLGLAITHNAVADHQGVILVESAPGAGSKFEVYLPSAGRAQTALGPHSQPAEVARGDGESILVVDDEPELLISTQRILQQIGYQVTAVAHPAEALKLLLAKPNRFRLLLSDLNMPGMSGLELIAAVRECHPTLPIILLSGYITEEHRAKADTDRSLSMLEKPATVAELAQTIGRALRPRTVGSSSSSPGAAAVAGGSSRH